MATWQNGDVDEPPVGSIYDGWFGEDEWEAPPSAAARIFAFGVGLLVGAAVFWWLAGRVAGLFA